jgi:hypothetical protein
LINILFSHYAEYFLATDAGLIKLRRQPPASLPPAPYLPITIEVS